MRLLLDTHVAIWWITGNEALPKSARALIADPGNDVQVSIVSLWEIAIKNALRRPAKTSVGISAEDAAMEFAASDFSILSLRPSHTSAVEILGEGHGDPFDRMLIAQSQVEGLRLMTHDRIVAAYSDQVLLV